MDETNQCPCNDFMKKLQEQVEKNTRLLENHLIDKGRVPETMEDEVAEMVREESKITKQEIKSKFDLSDYEALKMMRELNRKDIRYIPGKGNRRSKLYYTAGPIPKKAVMLLKSLDDEQMLERNKVEELLDVEGKKIHKIVRLAKEFSGKEIVWRNKKLVKHR